MTKRNGVQESDFKSTGGGLSLDNNHLHFTEEKRIKKKKKRLLLPVWLCSNAEILQTFLF